MANSETPFPSRKTLDHRGPISLNIADAVYFITIAAAERGGSALLDHAKVILDSARHLQASGTWFLHLLLIMPDHLHMLVHIRNADERPSALESTLLNWKHYLARTAHVEFQRGFFDTRIRDAAHFAEKWDYICRNPVARGLVDSPRAWPHSIAFDSATGCERPHR